MSTTHLLGLTFAFLGAMPPPRPRRPGRDGPTWIAAFVIGGVCLATVGPMITIWSFHRPHEAAKARCLAEGGRIVYGALDGSNPTCVHPAAGAKP